MCTGLEWMMMAQAGSALAGGVARMQAGRSEGAVLQAQAQAERDAAKAQAERVRRQIGQARGAARAAMAGAGIDVSQGSALVIDEDIARRGEEDALMLLLTGERRARELEFSGQQARAAGRAALAQSALSAAGRLARGRWRAGTQRQAASRPVVPVVFEDEDLLGL